MSGIENKAFLLTWPVSMQIYWNKRKLLHKEKKDFNSHRICLRVQNGRRFIVLKHQYGSHDIM